jgi:hypothetical protein
MLISFGPGRIGGHGTSRNTPAPVSAATFWKLYLSIYSYSYNEPGTLTKIVVKHQRGKRPVDKLLVTLGETVCRWPCTAPFRGFAGGDPRSSSNGAADAPGQRLPTPAPPQQGHPVCTHRASADHHRMSEKEQKTLIERQALIHYNAAPFCVALVRPVDRSRRRHAAVTQTLRNATHRRSKSTR